MKNEITNKEQAKAYLRNVLTWKAFCNTHKNMEKALTVLLSETESNSEYDKIRTKVKLNLSLTENERAKYLLFIANEKERNEFLKKEIEQ